MLRCAGRGAHALAAPALAAIMRMTVMVLLMLSVLMTTLLFTLTLMRMAADNRPPGAFSAGCCLIGVWSIWRLATGATHHHPSVRRPLSCRPVTQLGPASAGCCGWPCWAATRHVRDPGVVGSVPPERHPRTWGTGDLMHRGEGLQPVAQGPTFAASRR